MDLHSEKLVDVWTPLAALLALILFRISAKHRKGAGTIIMVVLLGAVLLHRMRFHSDHSLVGAGFRLAVAVAVTAIGVPLVIRSINQAVKKAAAGPWKPLVAAGRTLLPTLGWVLQATIYLLAISQSGILAMLGILRYLYGIELLESWVSAPVRVFNGFFTAINVVVMVVGIAAFLVCAGLLLIRSIRRWVLKRRAAKAAAAAAAASTTTTL